MPLCCFQELAVSSFLPLPSPSLPFLRLPPSFPFLPLPSPSPFLPPSFPFLPLPCPSLPLLALPCPSFLPCIFPCIFLLLWDVYCFFSILPHVTKALSSPRWSVFMDKSEESADKALILGLAPGIVCEVLTGGPVDPVGLQGNSGKSTSSRTERKDPRGALDKETGKCSKSPFSFGLSCFASPGDTERSAKATGRARWRARPLGDSEDDVLGITNLPRSSDPRNLHPHHSCAENRAPPPEKKIKRGENKAS